MARGNRSRRSIAGSGNAGSQIPRPTGASSTQPTSSRPGQAGGTDGPPDESISPTATSSAQAGGAGRAPAPPFPPSGNAGTLAPSVDSAESLSPEEWLQRCIAEANVSSDEAPPDYSHQPEDPDVEAFADSNDETRIPRDDGAEGDDDAIELTLVNELLGAPGFERLEPSADLRQPGAFVQLSDAEWNAILDGTMTKVEAPPPQKEEPPAFVIEPLVSRGNQPADQQPTSDPAVQPADQPSSDDPASIRSPQAPISRSLEGDMDRARERLAASRANTNEGVNTNKDGNADDGANPNEGTPTNEGTDIDQGANTNNDGNKKNNNSGAATSGGDEQRRRAEELEARLQESENARLALERRFTDVQKTNDKLFENYTTARNGRRLDMVKFQDRLKDKDEAKRELREHVERLQTQIVRANRNRSEAEPAAAAAAAETRLNEEIARAHRFKEGLTAARRREERLRSDLGLERDRANRLHQQLVEGLPEVEDAPEFDMEVVAARIQQADDQAGAAKRQADRVQQEKRALRTELRRAQDALKDSQAALSKSRADNSRLRLDTYRTANEFLDNYRQMLDPQSQLFDSLQSIANHQDRIGGPPTPEQRAEFILFRDYLVARNNVLREAMTREDARPLLAGFDEEWGSIAEEHDWGAMVSYKLSATRAAAAFKFLETPEARGQTLSTLMEHADEARERMGDGFDDNLSQRLSSFNSEMERWRSAERIQSRARNNDITVNF